MQIFFTIFPLSACYVNYIFLFLGWDAKDELTAPLQKNQQSKVTVSFHNWILIFDYSYELRVLRIKFKINFRHFNTQFMSLMICLMSMSLFQFSFDYSTKKKRTCNAINKSIKYVSTIWIVMTWNRNARLEVHAIVWGKLNMPANRLRIDCRSSYWKLEQWSCRLTVMWFLLGVVVIKIF